MNWRLACWTEVKDIVENGCWRMDTADRIYNCTNSRIASLFILIAQLECNYLLYKLLRLYLGSVCVALSLVDSPPIPYLFIFTHIPIYLTRFIDILMRYTIANTTYANVEKSDTLYIFLSFLLSFLRFFQIEFGIRTITSLIVVFKAKECCMGC